MSEQPQQAPGDSDDGSVLLNQITVASMLGADGSQEIRIAYSTDLGISQALGLLEWAKFSLVEAFNRSHEEP